MQNLKQSILLTFFVALAFSQVTHALEFRVLTFNAWFLRIAGLVELSKDNALRLSKMPDALVETGADIIALQEVWNTHEREILKSAMDARGYHYMAEQNDLSYLWFVNGLMVFSRFEISPTVNHIAFSSYTRADEFFTMKGAIHTQINVPEVGWIDFYTTHLGALSFDDKASSYYSGELDVIAVQAQEFVDFMQSTRSHPTQIVAGDMNQHPFKWDPSSKGHSAKKDIVYEILTENAALIDTVSPERNPNLSVNTYHSLNSYVSNGHFSASPDVCIDYIFINDGARDIFPVASRVLFGEPTIETQDGRRIFLSDHSGVLTTFATTTQTSAHLKCLLFETGGPDVNKL